MTKSKKTFVKLLICVLAMLALATVLVACNRGDGPAHYDYLVTFEYNKGNLVGNTPTQRLGVMKNNLVSARPGYNDGQNKLVLGAITGYYLEGWYLADLDENGNVVKDDDGFIKLGRKWNFKTDRVNEDITLYGNFKKRTSVIFKDRVTGKSVVGVEDYIPGDIVFKPATSPSMSGYTFLGEYYAEAEGTQKFVWNFTAGEEDITVYVDFLEGEWRLVKNENEFKSAINANRNIYLQNDLNFGNYEEVSLWDRVSYTGEINGNGHTVSNVTRSGLTASRRDTDNFGCIFGELGKTAYIHDINFVDINLVNFSVNTSYSQIDAYVGLLAGKALEGAKLENVTLTGALSYTPNQTHPIHAGVIGDNNIKNEDIIGCNFDAINIVENAVA